MIKSDSFGLLRSNSNIYAYKSLANILSPNSLSEVDITSRISHPYILSNAGIISSFILYPLTHYSLYDVISRSDQPTSWKLPFLHKIAQAINHLHQNNIIHHNIQIDKIFIRDNVPLLSLFSISSTSIPSDISYYAPEILTSNHTLKDYTKASDVWSFGIMMLYVLSEQGIYTCDLSLQSPDQKELLYRQMEYLSKSFKSYRNDGRFVENFLYTISPLYKDKCIALLSKIFSMSPYERPSMKDILLDPLFDDMQCVEVFPRQSPKQQSYQCSDDCREMLKILFHFIKNLYPKESAELIFLSSDLFYRVSSFYLNSPSDIRTTVVISCLYLSAVYLNCENISSDYIMHEVNNIFPDISFDNVIKYSHEIIENLDGIINLNPVYSKCDNLKDAKWFMFNLILSKKSSDYYVALSDPDYFAKIKPTISDIPENIIISDLRVYNLLKD